MGLLGEHNGRLNMATNKSVLHQTVTRRMSPLGGAQRELQEAFITNIDLTNGNERELLDNYWMPSISAGGKSAS